ncbi:MAG: hypothetical protein K9N36_10770, partial [Candidatus Marinimicrobia bacterium]|nr:hypothetical protein [Candidatus Neomarinimicrobiota bacterium]
MKRLIILALVLLPALIVAQSNHTVSFTGDPANDFNLAEKYTSGVVDYYLTFDASTIYFGAKNTSGNFNPADVLTIFIDTDPN